MDWATWIPLLIAIAAWMPKIIDWLASKDKDAAQVAQDLIAGGSSAVDAAEKMLERYENRNALLEARVRELEERREERSKQIAELQNSKEDSDRLIEEMSEQNDALRAGIAGLRKQIEKDTNETKALRDEVEALRQQVSESEAKYARAKAIIDKLVKALQDAKIPLPDDVKLSDSITGFKWDKP